MPSPVTAFASRPIVDALYRKADAARWSLTREEFATALESSVRHVFRDADPPPGELDRYLGTLHVGDLALATACAAGGEAAWNHFVLTHRPGLYRAADVLTPGGSARELADSLYADLYGLQENGPRRSLFRYFHGRSSLATWLRSVLSQRCVDSWRAQRRTEPLPDDESALANAASPATDPDRDALVVQVERSLRVAIDRLTPKDRLRLRSYYVAQLTLAEIGRVTGEHEATVSRHLTRTRRGLREEMQRYLRDDAGLSETQVARALELALEDPGELNLQQLLAERKSPPVDRSR